MIDFDGAVFDLDGTIADSLYVWKKVDRDFFGRRGMEIPYKYSEKIAAMSFYDAAVFTKKEYGFKESASEIADEWYSMAAEEYSFKVRPKKSAAKYLRYIRKRGVKTALCTASPETLYKPFLKNNNMLSLFDAFVSGSESERGKQFPDIYILAAKRLFLPPQRCAAFEDIFEAVKGAKTAGMKVFGVFDKESEKDAEKIKSAADGFIFDFSEMMREP